MAKDKKKEKTALELLTKEERESLEGTVKDYMKFINDAKVPELVVQRVINMAEHAKMMPYSEGSKWNKNLSGFYMVDRDTTQFALILSGESKAEDVGISILGAHNDAPCLNLKVTNPMREGSEGEGLILATKPYGGIWPHQWLDSQVQVIGMVPNDKFLTKVSIDGLISDMGIHISRSKVNPKKYEDAFPHEMLKVVTGLSSEKDLKKILKQKGLDESAFARGSWYVVPAGKPLKIGDMIAGYGHDDRVCVYTTVTSALEAKERKYPTIVYGCAREEIGSTGFDGAQSTFIDSAVYNLLKLDGMSENDMTQPVLTRIYSNSRMLSCDVDIALSTVDKDQQDEKGASRFNNGISVIKSNGAAYQSGGNLASNEMTGWLMNLLDDNKVKYQVTELPTKLQTGGGGTIAMHFAHKGFPVIDVGIPIANMHGKNPILHTGDLGHLIKAYTAFVERQV